VLRADEILCGSGSRGGGSAARNRTINVRRRQAAQARRLRSPQRQQQQVRRGAMMSFERASVRRDATAAAEDIDANIYR